MPKSELLGKANRKTLRAKTPKATPSYDTWQQFSVMGDSKRKVVHLCIDGVHTGLSPADAVFLAKALKQEATKASKVDR